MHARLSWATWIFLGIERKQQSPPLHTGFSLQQESYTADVGFSIVSCFVDRRNEKKSYGRKFTWQWERDLQFPGLDVNFKKRQAPNQHSRIHTSHNALSCPSKQLSSRVNYFASDLSISRVMSILGISRIRRLKDDQYPKTMYVCQYWRLWDLSGIPRATLFDGCWCWALDPIVTLQTVTWKTTIVRCRVLHT